ncbi:PREDICTED: gastrula zinc finger protein XlCGF26.1-like [Vollenhovia emeryi]|uniref:gastrula zinc finger protein XlCGF26.1-like n=1 Tax=Vollenhovia emeryi TaxID=411798 RepID=UPI0005F4E0FF|nr:PREDICTED: gastrula zinc finger protein XlCGF26.1-like [Vollenhovia emeryi]
MMELAMLFDLTTFSIRTCALVKHVTIAGFREGRQQRPSTLHRPPCSTHISIRSISSLSLFLFSLSSSLSLITACTQDIFVMITKNRVKRQSCVCAHGSFSVAMSLGFVNFREGGETFGGLSGMLRQILSPSPEIGEVGMSVNCNLLQTNSIFSNQSSMLSSTLLPPHFQSVCTDQSLLDQVQIFTESYPCPTCGLEFRSALKLNYHMRTSHAVRPEFEHGIESQPRYSCGVCSRTFVALNHLRMHEVTHSAPVPTCASTSASLAASPAGNMEKTFACDLCQASFRYRTLLERHRRMHQEVSQEKPYSCPRCMMRFETRNLYNHHAKTHRPLPASNDSRIVAGANAVSSPVDPVVAGNLGVAVVGPGPVIPVKSMPSYPCDSCSKQFTTAESLTTHKAVHRSRPLVCDVCGKGFTHRKYYVVHQRIHTGERPYLCAMCGKSFTQASTLTVHRRYHTGERPYTCTLCGKGFVTRTIMLNHMKKH